VSDMTNVEGRRPEGAPERSPKAGEGAVSGVDGKESCTPKVFNGAMRGSW
jgi:hypothetical protein